MSMGTFASTKGKREDERNPNTQQLRATIPSGRTPSTDSAHEPSMASFDTDDEAAGRPAQVSAIKEAMGHEGRLHSHPSDARAGRSAPLWILVAVAAGALLAWMLLS
jgi:hypothetical protein